MSIERDGRRGPIQFVCDAPGCTATEETGEHDFAEALMLVKSAGWRVFKVGNDWRHQCPGQHGRTNNDMTSDDLPDSGRARYANTSFFRGRSI